ncbi:MAG: peptide chain release factor 2, partial [Christensenellales bacterium]
SEEDCTLLNDAKECVVDLSERLEKMKLQTLLNGKYDNNVAIITIHAGAGGTEAQDWASMLFRMYQMYAEKNGFNLQVLDLIDGDVAGIKSVTFSLDGEYAYGYMKAEKGVHRLVRISPFDSGARRHTSFASVEVVPEIESDNEEIVVRPDEIRVDTYRASGAGGQHINKTDSAVRITHFETGIVVTCQNERSQIQNREMAMRILKSKLLQIKEEQEQAQLNEIKGEIKKIEWGSQIRSYVLCPYTLVKDHRTGFENANVNAVLGGDIQPFIEDYLKKSNSVK